MKKINRKRLNNKGFTLIELLAVVVILAVVMGIATTSVLSSMNNSRKGSLENSAKSTAQIFQTKHAEAMVTGTASSVFGVYNFNVSGTVAYPITKAVGKELNLSESSYVLSDNASELGHSGGIYTIDESFVLIDKERISVCLLAKKGGSYYVTNAALPATIDTSVSGANLGFKFTKDTMFACSDGKTSWNLS